EEDRGGEDPRFECVGEVREEDRDDAGGTGRVLPGGGVPSGLRAVEPGAAVHRGAGAGEGGQGAAEVPGAGEAGEGVPAWALRDHLDARHGGLTPRRSPLLPVSYTCSGREPNSIATRSATRAGMAWPLAQAAPLGRTVRWLRRRRQGCTRAGDAQ